MCAVPCLRWRSSRSGAGSQRCLGDAYLAAPQVRSVHVGEDLLDAPGFAGAGERLQQVRAQPRGERVGSAERGGQPFGGLEGAQGGVVTTAYELEHAAAVAQPHPGGRIGFGPEGALGPAECPLCFLEPSLRGHRHAEGQVGDAGDRLVGPPVLAGEMA